MMTTKKMGRGMNLSTDQRVWLKANGFGVMQDANVFVFVRYLDRGWRVIVNTRVMSATGKGSEGPFGVYMEKVDPCSKRHEWGLCSMGDFATLREAVIAARDAKAPTPRLRAA